MNTRVIAGNDGKPLPGIAPVVDLGRVRLAGFLDWLLCCVAHVCFLTGFRNRLSVALSWGWAYTIFQRGARLITGVDMEIISFNLRNFDYGKSRT